MAIDIWDEMMSLERRIDDLARAHLGEKARATFPPSPRGLRKPFIPRADVFTRDGVCVIALELAGVDPEKDVEVLIGDEELVVRGRRAQRFGAKEDDLYRMEVSYGSFERHFPLAASVDIADVKATYRDGILEVSIPSPLPELEGKNDWRSVPISAIST